MDLNSNNNESNNNDNNKVINFYWAPIRQIIDNIEFFCIENKFQHILEIGPGIVPFSLSTKTIGFNENIKDFIELDIDTNKLPFEDKSMDFIFSRHTLEDIQKAYQAKHNITEEAVSQLMSDPAVKSKVEMVIKTLQSIDIDGETMQYILEKVGMDEQMQHQLTPGGIR